MNQNSSRIAVLGAGLMGSALACALRDGGSQVIVWNRTHSKAEALAGNGITATADVQTAVASVDLVVVCMGSYADVYSSLDEVNLIGRTILNVTTGTAGDAAEGHYWATSRGGRYLDGAVIAYPGDIGTDRGAVLISGDRASWDEFATMLRAWGPGVEYIGEGANQSNVLDQALVHMFHIPALVAVAESAAYALHSNVDQEVLKRHMRRMLVNFGRRTDRIIEDIAMDSFETDQATIATYAAAARAASKAFHEEQQAARMLDLASEVLDATERAGWAKGSIGSVSQLGFPTT